MNKLVLRLYPNDFTVEKVDRTIRCPGRRNLVNVTRDDILDGERQGIRRTSLTGQVCAECQVFGEAGIVDGEPTRKFNN